MLTRLSVDMQKLYEESPGLAKEMREGLERTDDAKDSELAAWTVVVNTLYNLDVTKNKE